MSAVIHKAKQHYLKSLLVEMGFILFLSLMVFLFKPAHARDFLVGMLVGFLPHTLMVYWFFFRHQAKNQAKMTALYRGEGLKWLATILLIMLSIKLITNLNVMAFFMGYVLLLVLNNFIPFLLSFRK
ncbi:ATP synthase subunit I [Pasteurellaceae bacterium 22721_9_1]